MPERPEVHPPHPQVDEIGIVELAGILARRWHVIAGSALVAVALTALAVMVLVPRRWESTATLVVSPPGFGSELRPATLSLQGYQKLLESGTVIAEARERLVAKGSLTAAERLARGRDLETRIFVSRRSEETSLTPMVFAIAHGRSARQAADIANTWAEVFLETVRDLITRETTSTVDFINQQYHGSIAAILELEAKKLDSQTSAQRRYDEAADRWDRAVSRQYVGAASALASYRAETAELVERHASGHGIETRRGQIATLRASLAGLESEQGRVGSELARKQLELEAALASLAATPQTIVERKAISDDALWQAALSEKGKADGARLAGRVLVSETINPLHQQLSGMVAQLEIERNALSPRAAQLSELVAQTSATLREMEVGLAADVAKLTALTEQRQAGLMALVAGQGAEAAVLARDRDRELAELRGEHDQALAAIDRELASHEDVLKSLAKAHVQATLAESQPGGSDVHLAARAVVPGAPEARGTAAKSAVAGVLGGLLGLMLAFAIEARSRRRHA